MQVLLQPENITPVKPHLQEESKRFTGKREKRAYWQRNLPLRGNRNEKKNPWQMLEMQFYFLLYYIAIQIWPCCTEIWTKYFLKGKNNNLLQF